MTRQLIYPEGSWVALITPFDKKGDLDIDGFKKLVDFQAANGTNGLLLMGSTGEPTGLTLEERRTIIAEMVAYCRGKIPTFFGVTCGTTAATIELAQYVQEIGGDGIMIVVPPYIAPPQPAVYEYLKAVCQAIDLSVAIYNNPARVIVNMDPATIIRLARECPNLVADKEAMPNMAQLATVMEGTGGRIRLLCCDAPNYALTIPTLGMGGHGTANVTGNVAPGEMAAMSRPWKRWEDVEKGRKLYFENLPIMEAAYSAPNPVAIKAMVKLLGLPGGDPRPPLPTVAGDRLKALESVIDRFELRSKYNLGSEPKVNFSQSHAEGKEGPDMDEQSSAVCGPSKVT